MILSYSSKLKPTYSHDQLGWKTATQEEEGENKKEK